MSNVYFSSLNYSLANEDTSLEYELVKHFRSEKIFSITGSGARFIPLITDSVKSLSYVDMCKEQLLLAELKLATIRDCTYEEFAKFWTFAPFDDDLFHDLRRALFGRLLLSDDCRSYFHELFSMRSWATILYEGKWEKTFKTLYKINRLFLGKGMTKIFFCKSLEEQKEFYKTKFPVRRWHFVIQLLGNKKVFDALLYKGHFVKKNVDESYFEYYKKAFENLFTNGIARNSFFLNLCFFGRVVFPEGNTLEGQAHIFHDVKKRLIDDKLELKALKLDLAQASLELKGQDYDFISLSDVPSYFTGDLERDFLQNLKPILKKEAIVVIRYYLRVSQVNQQGYEDITDQFKALIEKEKVQMYRIKILRFKE